MVVDVVSTINIEGNVLKILQNGLVESFIKITWNFLTLYYLDPCTNQCIYLQDIANQLLDVFSDSKKIVKFHIPVANTPA